MGYVDRVKARSRMNYMGIFLRWYQGLRRNVDHELLTVCLISSPVLVAVPFYEVNKSTYVPATLTDPRCLSIKITIFPPHSSSSTL
jgi:hypothetical protein